MGGGPSNTFPSSTFERKTMGSTLRVGPQAGSKPLPIGLVLVVSLLSAVSAGLGPPSLSVTRRHTERAFVSSVPA